MSIFGKPLLTGVGKGSAFGAVVSFSDGAKGLPLRSLVADIEPVQDLHGYDNPWPAGSGKNKAEGIISGCNIDITGNLVNNSDYDMAYGKVEQGVTYALTIDSHTMVLGFFTSVPNLGSTSYDGTRTVSTTSKTFTAPITGYVTFRIYNGYSRYQLEEGSTATSYAPYSNICPISGWSAVNVWRTGKNLFDITKMIGGILDLDGTMSGSAYVTISEQTKDTITWSQSVTWKAVTSEYIPVTEGTTLFISLDEASTISYIILCWYDINKNFISRELYRGSSLQAKTAPNGAKYVRYSFQQENIGTYTYHNIMLSISSTATAYEPYTGNQYTLQLGQTAYGGTLDVTNGVLRITLKRFSYSSVDYYGIYAEHPLYMMDIPDYSTEKIKLMATQQKPGVLISNIFKKTTGSSAGALGDCEIRTNDGTTASKFYFRADSFADLTALNAYLSTNPLQVVAELATPITYQLTPTEVMTLLGQNNIWADTGDVDVEYLKQSLIYIGSYVH